MASDIHDHRRIPQPRRARHLGRIAPTRFGLVLKIDLRASPALVVSRGTFSTIRHIG
jgi:hypothetical protein